MRNLLAAIVLLAPLATPETVSCRVNERPADWSEVRTIRAYTGTDPLTALHVEGCFAVDWRLQFENTSNLSPGFDSIVRRVIRFEVAFDAGFTTSFIDTQIQLPPRLLTGGVYDGTLDFAGTSGMTVTDADQQLVIVNLVVNDPTFFSVPQPVYVRCTSFAFEGAGSGNFVVTSLPQGAAGIVFTYNP